MAKPPNRNMLLRTPFILTAVVMSTLLEPLCAASTTVRHLRLGFERPGVSLQLVAEQIEPLTFDLVLRSRRGTEIIRDLNRLKGFVTIRTAPDALKYVRLLTSYATGESMGSGPIGEVVSAAQYDSIPNYGVPAQVSLPRNPGANNDPSIAVLTNVWFRKCGLTPAVVRKTSSGFVVERWRAGGFGKQSYAYKVQETVGADGEYHETIVEPHHHLPAAIQWHFYGRK